MGTIYECSDKLLTIFLNGRIDSNSSAELDSKITEALEKFPNEDVNLNAEKLEYISSAGLRVLLKLQKKKEQKLKIINTSLEIYDILDVTGFINMFDVQKRIREVSVDGCELIGQGASSKVYRINDDTIVKIFDKKIGFDRVKSEQEHAKAAFVNGIPTAIAFDIVKCGECFGTMYELIDASPLPVFLRDNPDKAPEYRKRYALLMKELHQLKMPESFQDVISLYETWIHKLEYLLTDEEVKGLLELISLIPKRDTFVHCDFHVGNIMMQNDELVLVDMADIGKGNPVIDIGTAYFHYKLLADHPVTKFTIKVVFGFMPDDISFSYDIWDDLVTYYFNPATQEDRDKINMIASVIGNIRYIVLCAKHSQLDEDLKKEIIEGARTRFFPHIEEYKDVLKDMDKYF